MSLILSEGAVIHPTADGYRDVPRIATAKQAESWRPVVDAVHEAGAKIACQLWHCGRISHSDFTDGHAPVSSTTRAAEGLNRQTEKPYREPRALTAEEMPEVYGYFVDAARRAFSVGFDADELHVVTAIWPTSLWMRGSMTDGPVRRLGRKPVPVCS